MSNLYAAPEEKSTGENQGVKRRERRAPSVPHPRKGSEGADKKGHSSVVAMHAKATASTGHQWPSSSEIAHSVLHSFTKDVYPKVSLRVILARLLLHSGENPNFSDRDGRTALGCSTGQQRCGTTLPPKWSKSYLGSKLWQWSRT